MARITARGRPPESMKFSEIASNQSTTGRFDRISSKCWLRSPRPSPSFARSAIPLAAATRAAQPAGAARRHVAAFLVVVADPQIARAHVGEHRRRRPEFFGQRLLCRDLALRLLGLQFGAELGPVLLKHLARPYPDAVALVGAVGAEALGIDRRGAGAERFALVGAGLHHLLAGAVQATATLAAAHVLDMAGVVDGGRAVTLAGAGIGLAAQLVAEPVRSGAAVEAHASMQWHSVGLRADIDRKGRLLFEGIRLRHRLARFRVCCAPMDGLQHD